MHCIGTESFEKIKNAKNQEIQDITLNVRKNRSTKRLFIHYKMYTSVKLGFNTLMANKEGYNSAKNTIK